MHVMRVDEPTDDGVADFLVVNKYAADLVPNRIYTSENGSNPLSVKTGDVTEMTFITGRVIKVT